MNGNKFLIDTNILLYLTGKKIQEEMEDIQTFAERAGEEAILYKKARKAAGLE